MDKANDRAAQIVDAMHNRWLRQGGPWKTIYANVIAEAIAEAHQLGYQIGRWTGMKQQLEARIRVLQKEAQTAEDGRNVCADLKQEASYHYWQGKLTVYLEEIDRMNRQIKILTKMIEGKPVRAPDVAAVHGHGDPMPDPDEPLTVKPPSF